MIYPRKMFVLLLVLMTIVPAFADTTSFLVLHTNDMHDYIKPGPNNLGGVPYLSGCIASIRAERDDILLLDGGDVMEKGDMVAYLTESRIMYEAIKKMGYTAGAIGNHDLDHGIAYMKECEAVAGCPLLCLNHFNADGTRPFTPSTIVEVKGVKVGIIGMTNIRTGVEKDGKRLAEEAKRLEPEVDLTVVVAHIGSRECTELSAYAPEVDLFVSAHTHEVLDVPVVVPQTEALIVQAGRYAQYLGYLEVTVDKEKNVITAYDGKLIEMAHDKVEPDEDMIAWVKMVEMEHCPEASDIVGKASKIIKTNEVAVLAAAGIKEYANADVAFCHSSQIMRSGLFAGDVSINDLFRTGGQRGCVLVTCQLTGEQIETYLVGLVQEKRGDTEWVGFQADLNYDGKERLWSIVSSLSKDKNYTVVMPKREWEQRFVRVADKKKAFAGFDFGNVQELDFTFTTALAAYVKKRSANGDTLEKQVEKLMDERKM